MKRQNHSSLASIEDAKRKLHVALSKGNFKEAADLHNSIGNELRAIESYDEALEHHKEEMRLAAHNGDKMSVGIALRNIGETYLDMNKTENAFKHIKKYLSIAKEEGNAVEEQRAYITLGRTYLCFRDNLAPDDTLLEKEAGKSKEYVESAKKYFLKGYHMLEDNQLRSKQTERLIQEMKCGACQNIGLAYEYQEKLDECVQWLKKGISIGNANQLYSYVHSCATPLGVIYIRMKKFKEAMEVNQQAMQASKSLQNFSKEIESCIQEAKILFHMKEVELGKKILKKLRKRLCSSKRSRDYLKEIDSLLIAATKICRTQDLLFSAGSEDFAKRMDLHERIADNFVTLENFSEAICEYKESVKNALAIPLFVDTNKKRLSRLYDSIALTYKDQGDFETALEYFHKEMEVQSDSSADQYGIQTNIADMMGKLNKSENEVILALNKALDFAKQTKSLKREVMAMEDLGLYLKQYGKLEKAEKILERVKLLKDENNLSDTEETNADSQDLLDEQDDEVDLDNLTSDNGSESEEEVPLKKNEVGTFKLKRNQHGETALHEAAIKGNLKLVQRLLRNGHPVNESDYLGWTPLHEACNFGFYEIVEALLKHKANVNIRGGKEEKLTPLLDAANNGHCRVVQLLVKYGARVLVKDKESFYPIDLLIGWRERTKNNDSEEDDREFRDTIQLLKSLMSKGGVTYKAQDEAKAKRRRSPRRENPEFALLESDLPGAIPIPAKIIYDRFDPHDGEDAVDLYNEAMKGLRARNARKSKARLGRNPIEEDLRPLSPPPEGALLPEEKVVRDDWLIDDLNKEGKSSNHKRKRDPMDDVVFQQRDNRKKIGRRKRVDVPDETVTHAAVTVSSDEEGVSAKEPMDCSDSAHDVDIDKDYEDLMAYMGEDVPSPDKHTPIVNLEDEDIAINSDKDDSGRKKKNSKNVPAVVSSSDESDIEQFQDSDGPSTSRAGNASGGSNVRSSLSRNRGTKFVQNKLPFKFISVAKKTSPPSATLVRTSSFRQEPFGNVLRLKIHVLENVMLVPVEANHLHETIDWLCQECATRYFKTHGVKPILSLSTKDGALLLGTDTISLVLGDSETELVATVTDFDLPPLPERFKNACADQDIAMNADLVSAMNVCQSTSLLNLTDFYVRGKVARVICHSLQRQIALREICFSGCSLFDDGIKELSKALSTLPNVSVLNLSMNGMTGIGFQYLAEAFGTKGTSNNSNPPLSLVSLDVSHNSLGNSVGLALSELLFRLPKLKHLSVSDCNFNVKLFAASRTQLCDAISKSKLEDLDISYNDWGELGIEKILQKLNPGRIKSVDCSSCCIKDADAFSQVMSNFLGRNEDCCLLKSLNLTDCSLTDKALGNITEQFSRLVSLESLTVANNEFITFASLENILQKCTENKIPLTRLDFGCCTSMWEQPYLTADRSFKILEKKLQSEKKLSYLRVPVEGAININREDYELGRNETNIKRLFEEYSGSSTFELNRQGNSSIYELRR